MACPDCITGAFLPGEPKGIISTQGAYYSPAPLPDTSGSERAILLLTDVFGLPLKNCKIIADNLAKRLNCDVWVPDMFNGKPIMALNALNLPTRAGVKLTVLDWLRFVIGMLPSVPGLIRNRASVVDPRLSSFIATIKAEKKYEKIGAVGYCFGGAAAVRLGGTGLVNSIVVCHPGQFSEAQLRAIKVPASWVCAEDDLFWNHASRLNAEQSFAERKGKDNFVEYEFKDHKGTTHGFACRPDISIPEIKEAYEAASEQTVEWFRRTLAK